MKPAEQFSLIRHSLSGSWEMHKTILSRLVSAIAIISALLFLKTVLELPQQDKDFIISSSFSDVSEFKEIYLYVPAIQQWVKMSFIYLPLTGLLVWFLIVAGVGKSAKKKSESKVVRGVVTGKPKLPKDPDGLPVSDDIVLPVMADSNLRQAHGYISGSSRSGKTVMMGRMLEQTKRAGIRAVVYDPKGDNVERFYDSETDYIYNPFDARSIHVDPFELPEKVLTSEFDTIAEDTVPEDEKSINGKYWTQIGRQLMAVIAKIAHRQDKKPLQFFVDEFLGSQNQFETLVKILKEGEPGFLNYIGIAGGHTQSVMSTLNQHLAALKYMIKLPGQEELSLLNWCRDGKGIIFLPHQGNKESLKVCLTLFITKLLRTIETLDDNYERVIRLFIDEFPHLPYIEPLVTAPAKLGSKGLVIILAAQQYSQIKKRYGDDTPGIIGNCNISLIGRCNDQETAEKMSDLIGDRELSRVELTGSQSEDNGSMSYREALSGDKAVIPGELLSLNIGEFYARMPGYPIFKFKTTYVERPIIAKSFIPQPALLVENMKGPEKKTKKYYVI